MAVHCEQSRIHIGCVTPELFQGLSGFEAVDSGRGVERSSQHLTVVFGELDRGHALRMGLVEPAQTLPGGDLPNPDLPGFGTGDEHFAVSGEAQGQHGFLHHHEVVLGLVLEVLPDLARGEVPHLN